MADQLSTNSNPPAPEPSAPQPAQQIAQATGGQIIQAHGNVIITPPAAVKEPPPSPKKSLVERWQTWVALATAVLALVAGLPKLITEYRALFPAQTASFFGSVRDQHGQPIAGAVLHVEGKRGEGATDSLGHFDLQVAAGPGAKIRVSVSKDGRVGYDDYAWLNNEAVSLSFDTTGNKP